MKKIVSLLLVLTKAVFAQTDSSKALVYFKEKNVVIYLNDKKIEPHKKLKLYATGTYIVKAWAPHYNLLIDTFIVKGSENKFYTKKLTLSDNYKLYQKKQNNFKFTYIIPAALSVISGVSYYYFHNNKNQDIDIAYLIAQNTKTEYELAQTNAAIDIKRNEYIDEKNKYDALVKNQKRIKTQGLIVTSGCLATALTFFIIDAVRKRKPFHETPLLTRINPSYNPITKQVCVIIKL